jgi:DNA-binding XRE family transcriptional regulator
MVHAYVLSKAFFECRQLPTNAFSLTPSLPSVKGDLRKAFGIVLKELRIKKGLTQQQLADFAGMDRAYISELERGLLMPSLETFFKISHHLRIKPTEFIDKIERS